MAATDDLSSQMFYHGTKAHLRLGELIEPGYSSNYGRRKKAAYVYLSATLEAAIRGPSWPSAAAEPQFSSKLSGSKRRCAGRVRVRSACVSFPPKNSTA
jgi:hypothetical protein